MPCFVPLSFSKRCYSSTSRLLKESQIADVTIAFSVLPSCRVFFSCQTNIIRFRHTIDMFANGTLAYSRVKMDELQPSSTGAYRDGLTMTKNPACSFWSPFFTRAITDTEVVLALQPRHWDTTTYRGFEYNRIIVFHCRLFTQKWEVDRLEIQVSLFVYSS